MRTLTFFYIDIKFAFIQIINKTLMDTKYLIALFLLTLTVQGIQVSVGDS